MPVATGGVSIKQDGVDSDALMDGKFVLTSNTNMPAAEVATTYKSLWRVERTFREQKSTLEVCPIYHQRDDTPIGHIGEGFPTVRPEEREFEVSWPDLMTDLKKVMSVLIELEGSLCRLRTALQGSSLHAFHASGTRIPPSVTALDEIS